MMNLREALNNPNLNFVHLTDGHIVSERVARLIEIIHERYPGKIEVQWIPPGGRNNEPAFRICEVLADGRLVPFMSIQTEQDFTGEVLEQIFMADNTKGNVLTQLDARNEALRAIREKMVKEQMEEAADIAKHILKSPLNTYRVNKDTVIKDLGNRTR